MEGELWKYESGHTPTYEDMVKYVHHGQTILVNSPHFSFPMETKVVEISKDGSLVKLSTGVWGGCWHPICELSVIQLMTNPHHIKCIDNSKPKSKPRIFDDIIIQTAYDQICSGGGSIEGNINIEEDNEDNEDEQ